MGGPRARGKADGAPAACGGPALVEMKFRFCGDLDVNTALVACPLWFRPRAVALGALSTRAWTAGVQAPDWLLMEISTLAVVVSYASALFSFSIYTSQCQR